ncbi:L,D-transpeptidase [Sphingobium sp. CCH11-B1]|jgi:hypothetical protein|uniref:L,D-transpeptidase n=1 Tax=Sphingobium sp. CCH11-B1 TaxID=1768781 RepID=UPI000834CEC0|nr:L,D-transpeptidase [Sphingobium sp. CCH11-B1]MEA3390264.1 L,D-transpeptidase [Pseudomonadota bacterium]
MKSLSRLLLCLSLIAIPSVQAAEKARPKTTAAKSTNAKTPASKARAAKTSVAKASALPAIPDATEMVVDPTPQAARILNWVTGAADNKALPYVVLDKAAARIWLYDGKGKRIADAPVLVGIALGDDATPGVGAKSLAEIGPAEKTTPAGRFLAKFGVAAGKTRVLWVDYATSVALHTIPPGNPKEKRVDRMLSPDIADNRITFGCINVPKAFYAKVGPLFRKKGGYVYILPDAKPIEEVFPQLHAYPAVVDAA